MIPYEGRENLDKCMVITATASQPRFQLFEISHDGLNAPRGSGSTRTQSAGVVDGINQLILKLLDLPQEAWQRVFFVDDDQQFDADLLIRLLRHDLPIVAALTARKTPPFLPVVFKSSRFTGKIIRGIKQRTFTSYTWDDLLSAPRGTRDEHAVGKSGMLLKRSVIEHRVKDEGALFFHGMIDPAGPPGEDLDFCLWAHEHKYEVHVDYDTFHGHIDPVAAWPFRKEDGSWTIALQWGDGHPITLAAPPPVRRA